MADNRKYYYLKLKEDFFDSDELKILESQKDGYLYSNILLKLYLKSLSNAGRLMFRNVIPYTPEVLATLTGHQVGTVEKALDKHYVAFKDETDAKDRFMITDGFHDRPVTERNQGKYEGYVKIDKAECNIKKIIGRIRGTRPWHPLLRLLQKEAG